jgi:DNA-binding MarR family transcriptional regulator
MPRTIAEQSSDLRMGTFRLARRLRAEKSDDDLSDGQFSVLAALFLHGPHTLSSLAERERVSAPSMNRTVGFLEELGYLTRVADTEDKRRVTIALTPSGTDTVKATVKKRDAWLTHVLKALTPEERATIADAAAIMQRMAER